MENVSDLSCNICQTDVVSGMAYGLDPDTYVTKFREVAAAVKANPECNSTYMLWAPNIAGGDVDSIRGYTPYWPGDDSVDMVGLSFYFSGRDKR